MTLRTAQHTPDSSSPNVDSSSPAEAESSALDSPPNVGELAASETFYRSAGASDRVRGTASPQDFLRPPVADGMVDPHVPLPYQGSTAFARSGANDRTESLNEEAAALGSSRRKRPQGYDIAQTVAVPKEMMAEYMLEAIEETKRSEPEVPARPPQVITPKPMHSDRVALPKIKTTSWQPLVGVAFVFVLFLGLAWLVAREWPQDFTPGVKAMMTREHPHIKPSPPAPPNNAVVSPPGSIAVPMAPPTMAPATMAPANHATTETSGVTPAGSP